MAKQVKDMNRQFILKGIQVTFKHVNVCKISLYCDHHKLKIHWNIIYQNVKNSKSNNTLCWINCWEICISHTFFGAVSMENNMPISINITVPYIFWPTELPSKNFSVLSEIFRVSFMFWNFIIVCLGVGFSFFLLFLFKYFQSEVFYLFLIQ